ncbi:MAG TPA: hypothetical protein VM841_11020 [Actinomycetota bacterium]|nr:hypothetical protein [Actinomycetota bacterium]
MPIFGRGEARTRMRALERAGAHRQQGDAAAAVDELAPLLVEHPDDPAANVEMARSLQLLGDLAGAEEHYRRSLRVTLSYPIVVELAGVIGSLGRFQEADETLDAALLMCEKDPTLHPGEAHLMRAMLAAGSGRRDDAEAALSKLDDSKPSDELRVYARRVRERLDATAG